MRGEVIIDTTPVFQRNLAAYRQAYPIICNEGGSRSSKTYSVIQLLCGIAEKEPGKRISIVSHSLPHIKRGAFRDFRIIMEEMKLWDGNQWSATNFIFTFKNGSYIELFGLEDESKARGPGRDILFVNEANLIRKSLFDQLAMRTTGKIFLDWNPADFNSWVYQVADDETNKNIHSTYLDNIHNLSASQIKYIEDYKLLPDDFLWKVYGLGQRGAAKELIYTEWKYYNQEPGTGDVFYGLDFGYVHPTAMTMINCYEDSNYVKEMLYQSSLTTPEIIDKIKSMKIGHSVVYADAAEPDTIEEIFRAGINIQAANKDVWAGILAVKSKPLFIHSTSANLVREIQGYKWKKDKNDNILEQPVKAMDDAVDSMRYGIFTHQTIKEATFADADY